MEWRDDGWLYVAGGGNNPQETVEAPDLPTHLWPALDSRLPFTSPHYATPRGPASTIEPTDTIARLHGSESLESCFPKSLLARRLTNHNLTATTRLTFSPTSFQQMAGLTAYYNNRLFHHFYLSHDEVVGHCLHIHSCDDGASNFPLGTEPVSVDCNDIFLRAIFEGSSLQFSWSPDGNKFTSVGPVLDASILSDDYGTHLDFTGTFVGMTCVDLTGMKLLAKFHFLEFLT
jgi:xylan 1,4-beta-xylosidase